MSFRGGQGGAGGTGLAFAPPGSVIDVGDTADVGVSNAILRADARWSFPGPTAAPTLAAAGALGTSGRPVRQDAALAHTAAMHLAGGHADLIGGLTTALSPTFGMTAYRQTTGSVAASSLADVVVALAPAMPDLSYTVEASVEDAGANLEVLAVKARTVNSVTVTVANRDAGGAHTGTLHLLIRHDSQNPTITARLLGWINVADYGASPSASSATNTAAFDAAIAYAKTFTTAGNSVVWRGPPPIYVPPGEYQLGVLATIDFSGFQLIGAGKFSTMLQLTGVGPHIILGVYNATPANWWYGVASRWVVQGIRVQSSEWPVVNDRTRTRTFLQDNGGGSGHLTSVEIQGCKVGLEATSGSDFTVIDDCWFDLCDLGVYLGVASEQVEVTRSNFSRCVEGFVADWACQGDINGCWSQDSLDADFVFQSDTLTRLGQTPTSPSGTTLEYMWWLSGLWLESGADPGNRPIAAPRSILIRGTSAAIGPRYIHMEKLFVVAGGTPFSANAAIVEVQSGRRHSMKDVIVQGAAWPYAVKYNGYAGDFDLENLYTKDGYTAVLPYVAVGGGANLNPNARYRDRWRNVSSQSNSNVATYEEWSQVLSDVNAVRLVGLDAGVVGWAFNSTGLSSGWLTRIRLDIQQRKLIFETDTELRRVAANVLGTGTDDGFRTGASVTGSRASAVTLGAGTQWFDTTLNKPIWSDGAVWRDAAGNAV